MASLHFSNDPDRFGFGVAEGDDLDAVALGFRVKRVLPSRLLSCAMTALAAREDMSGRAEVFLEADLRARSGSLVVKRLIY